MNHVFGARSIEQLKSLVDTARIGSWFPVANYGYGSPYFTLQRDNSSRQQGRETLTSTSANHRKWRSAASAQTAADKINAGTI